MNFFRKRWVQNGLWIFAAVFIFAGMRAWQKRDVLAADGRAAPSITVQTLDGQLFDLSAHTGKPVLLFFFAPWCGVCKRNLATLKDLRQDMPASELEIVVVALGYRNRDEVTSFRDKYDVEFPVAMGNDVVRRAYGISSFPTTFLVDAQGRLKDSFVGYTPLVALKWALW